MLHKIAKDVCRSIRRYGNLKAAEAAKALGRKPQIVSRVEGGEQILTPEQEETLVKRVRLSRLAFVEIMCKVLADFLGDGRRVMIMPRGQYSPISPILRATDLYVLHQEKLDLKTRERIESLLHQGRVLDALADQTCSVLEKEVNSILEEALAARGERLLGGDGD